MMTSGEKGRKTCLAGQSVRQEVGTHRPVGGNARSVGDKQTEAGSASKHDLRSV